MSADVHDHIEQVLAKFDFALMRGVMRVLNWGWTNKQTGEKDVPEVSEIREKAHALLYAAATYGTNYCASGGLVARKEPSGSLSLAFEVTSATCSTVPPSDLPPL